MGLARTQSVLEQVVVKERAMGSKEKIGVAALVAFFLLMGVILFFTITRPDGPSRSIENNVLIEQRMKNRNL